MTTTSNGTVYSHGISDYLADQVLRIPGKHEAFATDFLGHPKDGEHPPCVRLEAMRNRETNTWQIVRVTLVSSDDTGLVQREFEVKGGLCFFDALHYCAKFQMAEEAFGKQPIVVAGSSLGNMTHYKIAAQEAGQVMDVNGNVHPCAYGSILTSGLFERDAHAIALKTKDLDLSKMPKAQQTDLLVEINNVLTKQSVPATQQDMQALVARAQDKNTLATRIDNVSKAGDIFMERFKYFCDVRFETTYGKSGYLYSKFDAQTPSSKVSMTAGLLSLGILPLYRRIRGNPLCEVLRDLTDRLKNFDQHVSLLPDNELKTLCSEFSKAAAYSFRMEYVAAAHSDFQKTNSSASFNAGLAMIEEAGALIGLSDTEIACTKNLYLTNKIPTGEFFVKLANAWNGNNGFLQKQHEIAVESYRRGNRKEKPVLPSHPFLKDTLQEQCVRLRNG